MSVLSDWVLLGYLLLLGFFTFHKDRWESTEPLRGAWVRLGGIPMTMAVFSMIRAGNLRDTRDLMLTEIWQNCFVWFFLGLSIYRLAGLVEDSENGGGSL